MTMMQVTLSEITQKFNVNAGVASGFMRMLILLGKAEKIGTKPPSTGRGKSISIYEVSEDTVSCLGLDRVQFEQHNKKDLNPVSNPIHGKLTDEKINYIAELVAKKLNIDYDRPITKKEQEERDMFSVFDGDGELTPEEVIDSDVDGEDF